LVEKKVSRTAAQELDARLRMLGSVSTARPSRRTTISPISPLPAVPRVFVGSIRFGRWVLRGFPGGASGRFGFTAWPPHGKRRPTCSVRNEPAPVRGQWNLVIAIVFLVD
jgi:hypothetical protein